MVLEVSRVTWVDEAPQRTPRPPLSCRMRLWHRWVRVHVEAGRSYVACERCRSLATPTIFDDPMP